MGHAAQASQAAFAAERPGGAVLKAGAVLEVADGQLDGGVVAVELIGRPTPLPWALHVDRSQRPQGYEQFDTFHPTFLYESLWNLTLVAVLLIVERRLHLRPGRLFVVYVGGYAAGRLWTEGLRIDPANRLGPLRVNEWFSIALLAACLAVFLCDHWRGRLKPEEPTTVGDRPGGTRAEPT